MNFSIMKIILFIKRLNDEGNYYYEYNITVYNTKTLTPPPTGGNGIPVYLLCGVILLIICASGFMLFLRPRAKARISY